jgi:hypothetical protein
LKDLSTSRAAHEPLERDKVCTFPPFGEEGDGVHRRQLFRNGRGYEFGRNPEERNATREIGTAKLIP